MQDAPFHKHDIKIAPVLFFIDFQYIAYFKVQSNVCRSRNLQRIFPVIFRNIKNSNLRPQNSQRNCLLAAGAAYIRYSSTAIRIKIAGIFFQHPDRIFQILLCPVSRQT